jgi:hypothetical protein
MVFPIKISSMKWPHTNFTQNLYLPQKCRLSFIVQSQVNPITISRLVKGVGTPPPNQKGYAPFQEGFKETRCTRSKWFWFYWHLVLASLMNHLKLNSWKYVLVQHNTCFWNLWFYDFIYKWLWSGIHTGKISADICAKNYASSSVLI